MKILITYVKQICFNLLNDKKKLEISHCLVDVSTHMSTQLTRSVCCYTVHLQIPQGDLHM